MFVVTNRAVDGDERGFDIFGRVPNPKGPLELRVVEVRRRGRGWSVSLLDDELSAEHKREIGIPADEQAFASRYVAAKTLERVAAKKRNVVFFIHGFNNDVRSVVERAALFEELYDVEVIPFSWPANGGGVRGVASYRSDKRDAIASISAVDRFLEKARVILEGVRAQRVDEIRRTAAERHPDNPEEQNRVITRMAEKECPFRLSLVLHSMGNYLFKKLLQSRTFGADELLFDNVVLVAADTNNEGHAEWVDRIRCRQRVYVTINEDDVALRASRIKAGEAQLARLGHLTRHLHSQQAFYVDFTDAPRVGGDHAYFAGDPVSNKRGRAYRFFKGAFNGERVESLLPFEAARRLYRV